ncbi:M1 family metallopeptidase [Aliifodinibius sp. S!AR15-10]|uniref:M1 family metallopeptidase n=1 Tax=Aliifodinibius sp. S!AR15-10 TaxID=2950437 RepID=UPI0028617F91|nr:M1 family metallopeptidase [Aliifodinibius sp. S!AR15-10]MDR8393870.1 M1 family metallopeptidase [Aliifodinibius sp. S!AR15-10]
MKSTKPLLLLLLILSFSLDTLAQEPEFTRADTLRGSITPQRAWWDVTFYDLHTKVQPSDSTISGWNQITYRVTEPQNGRRMQIDLIQPLQLDSIVQQGQQLDFTQEGDAYFVDIPYAQHTGQTYTIIAWYHGQPVVAKNPPWDGGLIWKTDTQGNPWIATANQGIGASVWWPNKDHQSDEPDSMGIHITVPSSIKNISNGRLRDTTRHGNGTTTWSWFVNNPINNYNVAVNAGNYVNFSDTLQGEGGTLDLNYWVLEPYLEQAKKQFVQTKPMLRCFENWFGPYPFYQDGFKLIHTPHLGMEHQSAVAYGNGFQNGYMGTDLSGTGWGLTWDFIIVHESGHEWFGNNITTKDVADMWVHEGFTNYSENLFVECLWGKQAGAEYVIGTRKRIQNDRPIIGTYGVKQEGSGDMYYKGGNLLHMIRNIIDDDHRWRQILRGLNRTFYHQNVTSAQVEQFISKRSGIDFSNVFDQYLRHANIPVLEYYFEDGNVFYRWNADVVEFDMPVEVKLDTELMTIIRPTTKEWRSSPYMNPSNELVNSKDYYIRKEQVKK